MTRETSSNADTIVAPIIDQFTEDVYGQSHHLNIKGFNPLPRPCLDVGDFDIFGTFLGTITGACFGMRFKTTNPKTATTNKGGG